MHKSFLSFSTPEISISRRSFQIKAVISEIPNAKKYPKVGAGSTGPISASELLGVVEIAAQAGAQVIMDAVDKPRNINYKGVTDLVTEQDERNCNFGSGEKEFRRPSYTWRGRRS